MTLDKVSKGYWQDTSFRALLENSNRLADVANGEFDLVYLAGGHGTMYDFPDDALLQRIISKQYENGKLVAAICHGVGGLLNVKLSDGRIRQLRDHRRPRQRRMDMVSVFLNSSQLPVTLTSFKAAVQELSALLTWSTSEEVIFPTLKYSTVLTAGNGGGSEK